MLIISPKAKLTVFIILIIFFNIDNFFQSDVGNNVAPFEDVEHVETPQMLNFVIEELLIDDIYCC